MSLSMRKVEAPDRGALVSIIEGTGNLTADEKACAVELLDVYLGDSAQEDYYFITAVVDGSPAGYACYGPRSLADGVHDLYWVVVGPRARGRGLGRALLDEVASVLAREGARMLVAETSGQTAYGGTRAFYLKCGFAEEARIKDFYRPGDDIVFYVKRFTQQAQ